MKKHSGPNKIIFKKIIHSFRVFCYISFDINLEILISKIRILTIIINDAKLNDRKSTAYTQQTNNLRRRKKSKMVSHRLESPEKGHITTKMYTFLQDTVKVRSM